MDPLRTRQIAARKLKKAFEAGNQNAIDRVTKVLGQLHELRLQRAQHIIAAESGFSSWGEMRKSRNASVGLAAAMIEFPTLTPEGIRLANPQRFKSRNERRAALVERRKELRQSVDDVEWAVDWLKKFIDPIGSKNRSTSSYGLKHIAESQSPNRYLSNGVMIAAAVIAGFEAFPEAESLNLWFNMSECSIARLSS